MIKRYEVVGDKYGDGTVKESDTGQVVFYEDYAELQQKLDAVVAENAALKSSMPNLKDVDLDNDNMDDVSLAEDVGFNDAVTLMNRWKGDTPATDAYLNSVRAEGVERLLTSLPRYYTARADIEQFAARLRSGTHDTADKAG